MSPQDLYRTPLDASKPEIRLLEVIEDKDTVSCKLHTVGFSSKLRFAALSYVWGSAADRVDIEIDGIQVPVSKSLANALKEIRKYLKYEFPDRDQSKFRIWVDAVCINQADAAERTEQVKLMRDIYSSADLVLGWLGAEDDEKIARAMTVIKVLSTAFRAARWEIDNLLNLEWLKICGLTKEPECDKFWNSLDYLALLPYWRRVWILQENVLASTLFYIAPRAFVEYSSLMSVCRMLEMLSFKLTEKQATKPGFVPSHIWMKFCPPKGTEFIQVRKILRFDIAKALYLDQLQGSQEEQQDTAVKFFMLGGTLEATDPKDHIYGLLGLSSLPLSPDYTKSVREVYVDYCKAVIETLPEKGKREVQFLRDAGSGVFENRLGLPSWAPQFPSRATNNPTLIFDGKFELTKLVPRIPRPTISDSKLQLSGMRLQTLKNVGGNPEIKNLQKGGDLADWVQDYIKRIPFYPTKIPSIWALFLVAARMPKLALDTPSMLLLLNFIKHLDLKIPANNRQRGAITYFQTSEADGLSVMIVQDGGNNPEMMACISLLIGGPDALEARMFDVDAQLAFMMKKNYHTKLFETDAGYLGMGPQNCKVGDIICVVDGYDDLVLLRKRKDEYEYVGPCMAYGIMDMYIKRRIEDGEIAVETFNLV
ncbi:heterokaryon incompatibility 6 OR allele [Fusarium beomiforme]|uniref:Heterokaryon incompatibility 6 OR allele n=1 Tax=Fusarium beomiforme TaxID=44412 RepID=A0A9P5AMZ9_9HYPO|nr:heterokaryon incompatibility 6 OR allele [Fusarium beomiforme]